MFTWPKTINSNGIITITGRHQTTGRRAFGISLMMTTGVAIMLHTFIGLSSPINRGGLALVRELEPAWRDQNVRASWYLGQFAFGFLLCAIAGDKKHHIYGWLVSKRTTVKISPDAVEVDGQHYNREEAAIQFTNMYPHIVQIDQAGEGRTSLGSLEETDTLRMFYGSNALIISDFETVRAASRFALACNAGLGRVASQAARGVSVVSIRELYQGNYITGQGRQSLPATGMVRRRQ